MFLCLVCICLISFFIENQLTSGSDSPLFLTPYLDKNAIDVARGLARVQPDMGNVTSYAGYFTVNKACGSNMFIWFFPAVTNWQDAPVILWLQGGPGVSSMYGLFELIGPFNTFTGGLKAREYSWTNLGNLLFIENPVGSGFSFTTHKCFAENMTAVSDDLYSTLIQFYKLFPELQRNRLYLAGESFAGHYIPALAVTIDKENEQNDIKLNLTGIVIGNALLKLDCHDYGSFLYQVGIADAKLRDDLYEYQYKLKMHVEKEKNYTAAFYDWDYILNNLIGDRTDIPSRFNILTESEDQSNYKTFVNSSAVQSQIHVGTFNFTEPNWDVYGNLLSTIAQPMNHEIEQLLSTRKYIVALYSGQLDIICMYTSTVCILSGLEWSGKKTYLNATRNIWYMNDKVVGWFKTADNLLLDILVKDSGHSVPYYKPEVAFEMMQSIVSTKSGMNPLGRLQNECCEDS